LPIRKAKYVIAHHSTVSMYLVTMRSVEHERMIQAIQFGNAWLIYDCTLNV